MVMLRRVGSWLAVALLWVLHWLPVRVLGAIGSVIGRVLYAFGRGRVTDTNLALCFPDMPPAQRKSLGRRHFRLLGRNAMEMSIMWFGSDKRALGLVSMYAVRAVYIRINRYSRHRHRHRHRAPRAARRAPRRSSARVPVAY